MVVNRRMKTDAFDFDLPRDAIAQQPATPRDSSRLLEVGRSLEDRHVRDLPSRLRAGDILVLNDTKVIPARLRGKRGEASIEITLHMRENDDLWRVFARPARRLHVGDTIFFADDFQAEVLEKGEGGEVTLRFSGQATPDGLDRYGIMPLPPYIDRPREGSAADQDNYQTVYAAHAGAVAAPTAGLHYTDELLSQIDGKGVAIAKLTLHVGAGTFLPVKAERVADHKMHAERGLITPEVAGRINEARARGGRVIATGTTVLRLLESAADTDGTIRPFDDSTDIFITPGYRFRSVDLLLTNFHLPRSTLFMLVSAFSGLERMKDAYAHAIETGYRFYSYGDSCLLHREDQL